MVQWQTEWRARRLTRSLVGTAAETCIVYETVAVRIPATGQQELSLRTMRVFARRVGALDQMPGQ